MSTEKKEAFDGKSAIEKARAMVDTYAQMANDWAAQNEATEACNTVVSWLLPLAVQLMCVERAFENGILILSDVRGDDDELATHVRELQEPVVETLNDVCTTIGRAMAAGRMPMRARLEVDVKARVKQ